MQCAERGTNIPKEQYGRRKGKNAIMHDINKRLIYDMIHLQRQPPTLCSNDAKSCYDCIVHSVVSMAMQQMGTPM